MIRQKPAFLSVSAAALVALALYEGYTDTAVVPVKGDRPTIGFGSTYREDGSPVQLGDTITPPKALARALSHIQKDEVGLKRCVTAPVLQVEYDIMVDHAYQYGVAETCGSSIVRKTNAGDYVGACQAYLSYRYITSPKLLSGWEAYRFDARGNPTRWRFDCSTPGNKICAGVWKRSQDRYQKCMEAQG